METLIQDIRYGLRMVRKNLGISAVIVISLALGIGANTAIFTVTDAVMLKSLPVQKPEELVLFYDGGDQGTWSGDDLTFQEGRFKYFSYPFYQYLREHDRVFSGLCAFRLSDDPLTVRVAGTHAALPPHRAQGHMVSGNYFDVLGVKAATGRTLTMKDDRAGAPPVALISYGYWKQEFGGEASALGKVVDLNGTEFTIVGVLPAEFFGERVRRAPDYWLPLTFQPQVTRSESYLENYREHWLDLIARLKPGVSRRQAQAEVTLQLQQFLIQEAGTKLTENSERYIRGAYIELAPGEGGISLLRIEYSRPLHILMVMVALVLLITCANIANLLLSRAAARQKEISMRMTLGAGRARLLRQLLTESLLLAGLGAAAGSLLASWGVGILASVFGMRTQPLGFSPDPVVFAFTLGICLLSALLFGLTPALRATRLALSPALKSGFAIAEGGGRKFSLGKALVSFQIAMSLLLLVGAGLFVRTLQKLEHEELGYNRKNALLVSIDPHLAGYRSAQIGPLYQQVQERVNALPGVISATVASYSPISGTSSTNRISVQGHVPHPGEDVSAHTNQVGSKYFETAGTPLLLGREIGPQDTAASSTVAVINETMAGDFFGRQNPIGHRFGLSDDPKHSGDIEIVGVVADGKYSSLRQAPERMIFLPLAQNDTPHAQLEIRTAGDARGMVASVRDAIHQVSQSIPITGITTLDEQVEHGLRQERSISQLSSFFGLLALSLACIGLYAAMAYAVARRTKEIGVRMALGARPETIAWMVMKETLLLFLLGIALGVPATLASSRLIASMLFGLKATDPLTLLLAALLMGAVTAFAGYLPARRATKVDPMVALRYE